MKSSQFPPPPRRWRPPRLLPGRPGRPGRPAAEPWAAAARGKEADPPAKQTTEAAKQRVAAPRAVAGGHTEISAKGQSMATLRDTAVFAAGGDSSRHRHGTSESCGEAPEMKKRVGVVVAVVVVVAAAAAAVVVVVAAVVVVVVAAAAAVVVVVVAVVVVAVVASQASNRSARAGFRAHEMRLVRGVPWRGGGESAAHSPPAPEKGRGSAGNTRLTLLV